MSNYKKATILSFLIVAISISVMFFRVQRSDNFSNCKLLAQKYLEEVDHKSSDAAFKLAFMYSKGIGVPQNYEKAFNLYETAAQWGHVSAQTNLGLMYLEGKGTTQDYKKAKESFLTAAKRGEPIAQFNLGLLYAECGCSLHDNIKAYAWISLAAELTGDSNIIRYKRLVEEKLNPRALLRASRLYQRLSSKYGIKKTTIVKFNEDHFSMACSITGVIK